MNRVKHYWKIFGILALLSIAGVSVYGQSTVKSRQKVQQKTDSIKQDIKNQGKDIGDQGKNIKQDVRKQGSTTVNNIKGSLPDSVPSLKKEARKLLPARPDSVGVSYENGKWNLPGGKRPSLDATDQKGAVRKIEEAVKNVSAPDVNTPNLKTPDLSKPDLEKLKQKNRPAGLDRKLKMADSVREVAESAQQQLLDARNNPPIQKVMSLKAVRKLYDSLGISRIDSMRALIPIKEEVTPEELAQALKMSFPSRPGFTNPGSDPTDMAKSAAGEELKVPNLSAMKLSPESMLQYPAIAGFQLPDSVPMLDSLKKLNLARQRLSMSEKEVAENVKASLIKQKPTFWNRTYLEGIVAFTKDQDINLFQASPALGYHFNESLSIGVGPSILIQVKEKKVTTLVGYRSFVKYEFLLLRQLAYVHLEDLVDPKTFSLENSNGTRHSLLAGGGFIAPVSKILGVNLCVLYRVNNEKYSQGGSSPWVIRVGLSSIKSKKNEIR